MIHLFSYSPSNYSNYIIHLFMSLDGIFAKQLNITSNEYEYFELESLDNFNWNLVPYFVTLCMPLYLKNNISVIRLLEKKLGGILLDLLHQI